MLKNLINGINPYIHFTLKGICVCRCLFLFCLLACKGNKLPVHVGDLYKKIDSIKTSIHAGDIIVRNGIDGISRTARSFNRKDTSYSHCGIAQTEDGNIYVYHAIGGSGNPSQYLKREVLDSFCNPLQNDKFAIYRYALNDSQSQKLSVIVKKYYTNQLPFDVFFNFYTDDKMYCSEFVFKSLNQALNGGISKNLHKTNPQYVTIDDLYVNPDAKLISRVNYNIAGGK